MLIMRSHTAAVFPALLSLVWHLFFQMPCDSSACLHFALHVWSLAFLPAMLLDMGTRSHYAVMLMPFACFAYALEKCRLLLCMRRALALIALLLPAWHLFFQMPLSGYCLCFSLHIWPPPRVKTCMSHKLRFTFALEE